MLHRTFAQHLQKPDVQRRIVTVCATLLIASFATNAMADEMGLMTGVFCMIANFFNTTFLFVAGLILIIISAIGIASSESTIMKFVSGAGVGVGLAAIAVPLLKKYGIGQACSF